VTAAPPADADSAPAVEARAPERPAFSLFSWIRREPAVPPEEEKPEPTD
jgi:hypothetical protein